MKNNRTRVLASELSVNAPVEKVFSFFARAENLDLITPPELKFRILTPLPVEMKKGTLIDYTIKLSGVPFRWKTIISHWEPPNRFVDEQLKGPYKIWVHEHIFQSQCAVTIVKDTVRYLPPGNIAEPVIHRLIVKKRLDRIFNYRKEKISEIFNR